MEYAVTRGDFRGCGGIPYLSRQRSKRLGGTNTCFARTNNVPGAVLPGIPTSQTLWEITPTLQYKPIPSLITRVEFRYDKSDKNVFLYVGRPANNQETLSFELIYLF